MNTRPSIFFCRHCQERVIGTIVFFSEGTPEVVEMGHNEFTSIDSYIYMVKCGKCSEFSLFEDWEGSDTPGDLSDETCRYPVDKMMGHDVPELLKDTFAEA